MLTESWLSTVSPLSATLFSNAIAQSTTYRLHTIVIDIRGRGTVAAIYDGNTKVHEVHADNEVEAFDNACQWIDEQDESLPAYDLHAG